MEGPRLSVVKRISGDARPEEEAAMKTVLTVDDSRVTRTSLAHALTPWGCRVIEARNGREGVAVAQLARPDLIILDVLMPVLDGPQALAILRHDPICRSIPVVMLTAITGESLVEECSHLGISGYLVKPIAPEVLADLVGRILGPPLAMTPPALGAGVRVGVPV
jgi:CheY-like chemotaxis protein